MRNSYVYGVGGVVSADIAVPEHERELLFYSKILTTGAAPFWREDLINNNGTPVIGLGARTPEYESLPLQWMPHFQVADVAASVASALDMGGTELWHSKTDDGQSQWAVLADPVGAAFGVIPVVPEAPNSSLPNERFGTISWLSLAVPDASVSRDFYQRVVGWNALPVESEDAEEALASFEMLCDNGVAAAEISPSRSGVGDLPSVWLLHLPVGDLAESLRRVREGGGAVIKESTEAGYAIVRDPVGVYFALLAG